MTALSFKTFRYLKYYHYFIIITHINAVSAKLLVLISQELPFNFIPYMLIIIIILSVMLSKRHLFLFLLNSNLTSKLKCIERPYFFGSQSRRMCWHLWFMNKFKQYQHENPPSYLLLLWMSQPAHLKDLVEEFLLDCLFKKKLCISAS